MLVPCGELRQERRCNSRSTRSATVNDARLIAVRGEGSERSQDRRAQPGPSARWRLRGKVSGLNSLLRGQSVSTRSTPHVASEAQQL